MAAGCLNSAVGGLMSAAGDCDDRVSDNGRLPLRLHEQPGPHAINSKSRFPLLCGGEKMSYTLEKSSTFLIFLLCSATFLSILKLLSLEHVFFFKNIFAFKLLAVTYITSFGEPKNTERGEEFSQLNIFISLKFSTYSQLPKITPKPLKTAKDSPQCNGYNTFILLNSGPKMY